MSAPATREVLFSIAEEAALVAGAHTAILVAGLFPLSLHGGGRGEGGVWC